MLHNNKINQAPKQKKKYVYADRIKRVAGRPKIAER